MKPADLRDEAVDLARRLRRKLERERAQGLGDLAARAAAHGPGSPPRPAPRPAAAPAPAPPAATTPAPAAPRAAASQAPARPLVRERPAPPPASVAAPAAAPPRAPTAIETDLFGRPVVRVAPAAPGAAGISAADSAAVPLHPWGAEARAAIAAAAEPVLATVAEEVRACQKCGLWESRSKAVPGVGGARSGLVFIGEAPGADEDRLGEPFVGRAGQLLDKIIQAMNDAALIPGVPLSRATVFIGNIIHCRPPENRVPQPFEVEQSSPYLRRQLEALKPRVICCLGKTAADFLVGARGSLASLRGRVYRYGGAKVIVTYHPAACLRNPEYKRPVWEDMQLLAREYLSE